MVVGSSLFFFSFFWFWFCPFFLLSILVLVLVFFSLFWFWFVLFFFSLLWFWFCPFFLLFILVLVLSASIFPRLDRCVPGVGDQPHRHNKVRATSTAAHRQLDVRTITAFLLRKLVLSEIDHYAHGSWLMEKGCRLCCCCEGRGAGVFPRSRACIIIILSSDCIALGTSHVLCRNQATCLSELPDLREMKIIYRMISCAGHWT